MNSILHFCKSISERFLLKRAFKYEVSPLICLPNSDKGKLLKFQILIKSLLNFLLNLYSTLNTRTMKLTMWLKLVEV